MNNRPVASLTPTLLARKGAARPAMRPQLQPLRAFQDNTARQLDDLGWNDMGTESSGQEIDGSVDKPAEMSAAEQPAPVEHEAEIVVLNPAGDHAAARIPDVVHQQEQIAERLVQPRRSALSEGRRAAFTLRLDHERHLKLRLASVTMGRSAQQLVTEALDRLIAELPDVAELAASVRKRR
ncbi:MAG: hypothetical protein JF595_09595 [Sphingomonadales bacterium]|nr:hypothetical protein [Sphingomonadales bacterium]